MVRAGIHVLGVKERVKTLGKVGWHSVLDVLALENTLVRNAVVVAKLKITKNPTHFYIDNEV